MPAIYYAHGYKRDGTLDLEKISDAVEPYYTNWNDTERRIYWDFRLNYDQTFNKVHKVGALVKAEWSDYEASKYNQLLTAILNVIIVTQAVSLIRMMILIWPNLIWVTPVRRLLRKVRNLVGFPLFL